MKGISGNKVIKKILGRDKRAACFNGKNGKPRSVTPVEAYVNSLAPAMWEPNSELN